MKYGFEEKQDGQTWMICHDDGTYIEAEGSYLVRGKFTDFDYDVGPSQLEESLTDGSVRSELKEEYGVEISRFVDLERLRIYLENVPTNDVWSFIALYSEHGESLMEEMYRFDEWVKTGEYPL